MVCKTRPTQTGKLICRRGRRAVSGPNTGLATAEGSLDAVGTERELTRLRIKPAGSEQKGDRAYAAMGRNNQRIPATPLVAQLVPRHLTDRRVLRTGAREVDDDEFLALAPRLGAVADLSDLGVDVRLGHRAVGDRRPEFADLGRLLREVRDVLRGLDVAAPLT